MMGGKSGNMTNFVYTIIAITSKPAEGLEPTTFSRAKLIYFHCSEVQTPRKEDKISASTALPKSSDQCDNGDNSGGPFFIRDMMSR